MPRKQKTSSTTTNLRRSTRERQRPRPWWDRSAFKENNDKENNAKRCSPAIESQKVTVKEKSSTTTKARSKNKSQKATRKRKTPIATKTAVAGSVLKLMSPASISKPTKKHTPLSPIPSSEIAKKRTKKSIKAIASPLRYDTSTFLLEMQNLMKANIQQLKEQQKPLLNISQSTEDIQKKYDELLQLRQTQPEQDLMSAIRTISELRAQIVDLKAKVANQQGSDSRIPQSTVETNSIETQIFKRISGVKLSKVTKLKDGRSTVLCTHIFKPTQAAVR